MIRIPEVRALARVLAAVVLSVVGLGASPAGAATVTISDSPFSGDQTLCPRDNAAPATPIPVNQFRLTADAPANVARVVVRIVPAGAYANLERVEIRAVDPVGVGTLYGSIIPNADLFYVNLSALMPAGPTPTDYRVTIVPRRHQDMPPAALGKSYAIQAQVTTAVSYANTVTGTDVASATVTVDNATPANVTWSGVTSAAAIQLNWAAAANVIVLRRELAPVEDAPVDGTSSYATNGTIGTSSIVFAGNAASVNDATVTATRPYYYKVFTRSNNACYNYSSGAPIGPIFAGGTSEGDVATPPRLSGTPSTKPVVGIVSPGNGPATRPFKVKIRVFSPNTTPITEVRLYGNRTGTEQLLGTSIGASPLVTRNANYDEGGPVDPASGFYEFTAPAGVGGFADGNWTLRAWAANVAAPALADGVYSGAIGVIVGPNAGDGKLLVRDNDSQLCADCHKVKTHSSESLSMNYGSWYVGCRGCHDPHGTTNAKLIAKEVTPPGYNGIQAPQQIYYTGATGNVNGGKVNPSGTGLCQACHMRTAVFTRGNTTDFSAHDNGQPCANCHKHDKGLGASCSSCHGEPTRAVPGGDSMQSAAPPRGAPPAYATTGNAVGMHLAHVTGTSLRSAAIPCGSCHVMPNAHNGTVDAPTFPFIYPPAPASPVATSGTWNAAASTCTSTWCHAGPPTRTFAGSNRTPNWLTTSGLTCQSCHLSPPEGAASYAHSPASSYTNCSTCHGAGYELTGITGDARLTHINGQVEGMSCTGCHGGTNPAGNAAPPAAATASVNAVGAHQSHVVNTNFTASPLACSDCHPMPGAVHPEGSVVVTLGDKATNGGTMPATYQGLITPANPTCTSVYCHAGASGGSTAAPNWTTGTAMNCASCHGNPPAHPHPGNTTCLSCHPSSGSETYSRTSATTGTVVKATHIANGVNRTTAACTSCHGTLTASGVTLAANTLQSAPGYDTTGSVDTYGGNTSASPGVGAHRTHLTATRMRPGGAAVCTDCHVLPPTDADTAHAQDAGTGGARAAVRFLNTGGLTGTYSGSTSGADGSTAGNCSATYCHGGKFTTAPYQGSTPAPNWSGTAMNCGSCHLFPPTTHTFVSTTMQCGACHSGWTNCTTANQATCIAPATHIDPVLAPAPTTTCTSCHGGTSGNYAPPEVAIKSPVGPNAVGAHQSHLATAPTIANSLTCDDCHIPVTQLTSANHNNGTVNTQFTTARSTGTAWSGGAAGTSNCSTSWCHGGTAAQAQWGRAQPNPLWNDATDNFKACNACHGNPPLLNAATHHPPNTTTACTVCHGAGYGATISGAALGTHIDSTRTINFRAGCTGCHGDLSLTGVLRTSNASAPGVNGGVDISGATSGTRIGAHVAHLNGTRLRTATLACSECHPVPLDGDLTHADGAGNSTGARANVSMPGTLANGTILGGANTNPSYSSPTCSSVYCHGSRYVGRAGYTGTNSGSPQWTQTTAVAAACGTCHAAAPTAGSTHTNANAGTEACSLCHTTYLNCTKADNFATCQLPVEHINGQFDSVAGGCGMCHGYPPATIALAPAPFPGATHPQNPVCGNCHGSGYNTTDYASLPGSHGGSTVPGTDGPNNGCTACHGVLAGPTAAGVTVNTAASNAPGYWVSGTTFGVDSAGSTATSYTAVGAHDAHVRKTNLRNAALECTQCHYGLLPASGNVSHSNGNAQTAFDPALAASGGPVTWNRSAATCAATYCHGNFPNGNDRISGGTPTTPGQVLGLSSPSQTNRSISLSWTAVTGAVLYKIERSDTAATGPFAQIGTSAANSYLDDGLWDGRTYYYRVRAWNTAATGDGTYSATLTQQAPGGGGGTPTARVYDWQWTSTGSYAGLTANLPALACGDTTYPTQTAARVTTMSLTANTCTMRLYTSVGGTANTPLLTIVLNTPYTVSTAISAGSVVWTQRAAAATTVGVQLGYVQAGVFTGFGTPVQVNLTTTTQTAATTSLAAQTGTVPSGASLALRYTRVTTDTNIVRFYFSGTEGITNVTETPSGTPPTLPAVPTGVAANFRVTGTTQNTVSVAWDPVANTSTYHVERGPTQTGAWTQVAEVAAGAVATTVLTDRALTASNTYYYRVIASNPAGNSSGGYTTNTVSGTTSAPAPVGAVSWTGSFVPGSSSLTCTSCHGNPPGGTHPTSANACDSCHPGYDPNTANPQNVDKNVHMNGVINVDCVGCHSSPQGTRDAVASEFGMTWSHKRGAGGRVNKWDCIVCHMEGSPTTGERVSGVHADGFIDLRNPDTGLAIEGVTFSNAVGANAAGNYNSTGTAFRFPGFSRNLGVRLESDTTGSPTAMAINQAIMINQCLKCHDSNGATAFNATNPLAVMATGTGVDPAGLTTNRTASMPFGMAVSYTTIAAASGGTGARPTGANGVVGGVIDVNSSFLTTNSSYHPVLGRNNNGYTNGTRMTAPWNTAVAGRTGGTVGGGATTTVYGYLISCWDCHAPNGTTSATTLTRTVTAHGGATSLRGSATVSGTPSTTNRVTLCAECHAGYLAGTASSHGTGSAFAGSTNGTMTPYINYGCNGCHSSGYTTVVTRPYRAEDSHGYNALRTGTNTGRWAGSVTNVDGITVCYTGGTTAATATTACTAAQVDRRPYAFIRNNQGGAISIRSHHPARIGTNQWYKATATATTATGAGCDMGATGTCSRATEDVSGNAGMGPFGTY